MPYNFVADGYHTKKLCSRLSSSEMQFKQKKAVLRFWAHLWGGLGATYNVYLRLIGKRVVDLLLVLTELFFARCYGWGATSEYRLKIGFVWTEAQNCRYNGSSTIHHSSCRKTKINVLSCGIRMWTQVSFVFFHNSRVWQTDRRTDISLVVKTALHRCSTVKHNYKLC